MQEKIRKKILARIQEQREKGARFHGKICPSIFNKLKSSIARTQFMEVLWNGKDGFEVQEGEYRRFTVDLEKWTCSCRYWELSGLPCCHAISAVYTCGLSIDDFIAPCYFINTYNQIYDHVLQPVEGKENWPVSTNPRPDPPVRVNNKPGRKKTERTREEQEKPKSNKISRKGVKMTC